LLLCGPHGRPKRSDHVDPARDKLSGQLRKTILTPVGHSVRNADVLSFVVAKLLDVGHLPALLSLNCGERCKEAERENHRERNTSHEHLGWDGWRGV
jgi:hypothetical protein